MPQPLTIITIVLSFLVTLFILPYWIKRAHFAKLTAVDIHKLDQRQIAEVGGLAVLAGFLIGILLYVGTKVFYYQFYENLSIVFATLTALLIAAVIGLVDDILGWKIGLRARYKVAITFFIALPIIVINSGQPTMFVPLLGTVDFGILFPLVFIPLAIIGTSNGFNMIAGYNGLEAGLGIIILSTLGFLNYNIGNSFIAVFAFTMVAALFAFWFYNKYPAKVFPGNTLTYAVGSLIGIIAIWGNIEKFALLLFIPYFFELLLKLRGRLLKESFGQIQQDGTLRLRYDKLYGLEHVAIVVLEKFGVRTTEKNVVYSLYVFQLCFAALTLVYFFLQ